MGDGIVKEDRILMKLAELHYRITRLERLEIDMEQAGSVTAANDNELTKNISYFFFMG